MTTEKWANKLLELARRIFSRQHTVITTPSLLPKSEPGSIWVSWRCLFGIGETAGRMYRVTVQ